MYISGNSVFLNFPKTGSTFVRNSLVQVNRNILMSRNLLGRITKQYNRYIFHEHLVPQIRNVKVRQGQPDPHGVCDQIPKSSRHKRIFSVYRTPIDKLKSAYKYADFKNVNYFSQESLKDYPNFPDLTFNEFVDIFYSFPPGTETVKEEVIKLLGPQSIQFIKFYFKNGIGKLNDGSILDCLYNTEDRYEVEFMNFNTLSDDLFKALKDLGYKEEWISFIKSAPKLNVTNSSYNLKLSQEQIEMIQKSEKLLYKFENELGLC